MLFSTTIVGKVGRDAELKDAGAHKVCKFSVAVNPQKGKTVWVNVTSWDKRAEIDSQYVKKGMTVMVEGVLQSDENGKPRVFTQNGETKAAGFELNANRVLYLSKVAVEDSTPQAELNLELETEEIPF